MHSVTVGEKGNEKCFLIKNNDIIAEILKGGKICRIKIINYISADKKVKKYYIKRGAYIIGWINQDLSECQGKNAKHQKMLINILSVLKKIKAEELNT